MSKYKYIKADVYRRGITIFIGPRKELPKFVKKAYEDCEDLLKEVEKTLDEEGAIGTTYMEEFGQTLIWIPKFPSTPAEIGSLAHEILHATMHLLDYINVEYRYDGPNEPYTYLLEYFLTEALSKEGYEKVE